MSSTTTLRVRIDADAVTMDAELNDTDTARVIWEALPFGAPGNTWGDEIYFAIPVVKELEKGQDTVELGDLGYWPPGKAFCIFFGPTPASQGDEIRPASAVTVVGKLLGDPTLFRQVPSGQQVTISIAS
ncbi:MAG: hypothetical protein J4F43_04235 [Dehalococcoidia bacterium]|nr:hypothetical protein [Dehalococcoidia bacterium]